MEKVKGRKGSPLHWAARRGDVNLVKELILKGESLEAVDKSGKRPIHLAIIFRQNEVLDVLISHKCDVNAVSVHDKEDGVKFSPLCVAAAIKNKTAFEALVAAGADVNAENSDVTPLILCAVLGLLDFARVLINNHARVDEFRKNQNPLLLAVMYGATDMADLLLSNGASIDIKNVKSLITPLHAAIVCSQLNSVKLLVRRGADINVRCKDWGTPLSRAIKENNPQMVEFLLANGADVNYARNWKSLQSIVATSNTQQILKLLLKYGLRLNGIKNPDKTPLVGITKDTDIEIIQILLDNKVKINSVDSLKLSPIHYASFVGHVDAVRLFVSRGASIDCCGPYNWTPLHIAAGLGFGRLVEYLLLQGADVNKKDSFRLTPLFYALKGLPTEYESRVSPIGKPFLSVDPNSNERRKSPIGVPFLSVDPNSNERRKVFKKNNNSNNGVEVDAITIVTILIISGAHIDLKLFGELQKLDDEKLNGHTVSYSKLKVFTDLYKGAAEDNVDLVKAAINAGTLVDSVADKVGTPLMYACKFGSGQVVEAFLASGANPNFKTDTGMTPLHYASSQGDADVVLSLLWKGAVYDALNNLRRKPIYYAKKANHAFIVNLFIMIEKLFHSARNGDRSILSSLTILKNAYSSKRTRKGINKLETPYQFYLFFIIKSSSGENLAQVAQAYNNSTFVYEMWDNLQIK